MRQLGSYLSRRMTCGLDFIGIEGIPRHFKRQFGNEIASSNSSRPTQPVLVSVTESLNLARAGSARHCVDAGIIADSFCFVLAALIRGRAAPSESGHSETNSLI